MDTTARLRGRVDKQGRLVIPAELRRQLGIEAGGPVTLELDGYELRVSTIRAGIRRAQEIAARYTKGKTGLVDDFLAERRREAERD